MYSITHKLIDRDVRSIQMHCARGEISCCALCTELRRLSMVWPRRHLRSTRSSTRR
jgi:hypothetical protein